MVTYTDSITGKELSYHIDKKLKEKWDKIRNGQLIKQDDDRVYIVDGRERTGKSLFTLQQAKYIDPSLTLERICFTPKEFLHQIRTAPKGSCIIFDEAFRGLSSKGSQSKVNKMIVQAMMEMGQRNLVIFIVLPTFFLLEMYAAVLRSHALFHVFKDSKGIRRIRTYNYQKKSLLYNVGKKRGFSYSYPRVKFNSRFFNIYPIDEESYRKKKYQSLKDMDEYREEGESEKTTIKNLALMKLYFHLKESNPKLKKKEFVKQMNDEGIHLSYSGFLNSLTRHGEEAKNTQNNSSNY